MGAGLEGSVRPFTQEGFHDAFRQDLLQAQNHVLILSPFLAVRRATGYYAYLQDAVRRGCRVDICTKPEQELSGDLRADHPRVVSALSSLGAAVHVRPAMHEKIAILDSDLLWSGSLNILSHNSTTESMLRFSLPGLADTVLEGLRLDFLPTSGRDQDHEPAGPDAGMPAAVAEPTGPRTGACADTGADAGMGGGTGADTGAGTSAGDQDLLPGFSCPHCGHPVGVRRGVRTRIACSNPDCDFRMDPQLTKWLLKALRHQRGTDSRC